MFLSANSMGGARLPFGQVRRLLGGRHKTFEGLLRLSHALLGHRTHFRRNCEFWLLSHDPLLAIQCIVSAKASTLKEAINVRFGSLADMCSAQAHVCFVPIADRGAELSCPLAGITRNAQPPGALDRQPLKQVSRSKS
ncbi:MAG: hypothetical protein WCD13_15535, partial [Pseudolabrys sp.]